jgi:uncharacterized protein
MRDMASYEQGQGSLLGGVSPERWDRLAGTHFYSTAGWLAHCASYPGAECEAAVVTRRDGSLTAVPTVRFDSTPPANYNWGQLLAQRELPGISMDGIHVGPRLAYCAHILGEKDCEALAALVAGLREMQRPVVAMYLGTPDVRALQDAGVQAAPVLLEPDAWIDVPEGGWEEWLGALPRNQRRTVRREVEEFQDAELVIEHVPLPECWQQLPVVAESQAMKYGYSDRKAEFMLEFERYVKSFGTAATVALCRRKRDDELLGFCMYFARGEGLFLRWASFRYDLLEGHKEYFNTAYYSQIHIAQNLGVRHIHAGKSTLEAKMLRGARLSPLWLLDLSEESPHAIHAAEVRHHNAEVMTRLYEQHPLVKRAIADRDEWELYC